MARGAAVVGSSAPGVASAGTLGAYMGLFGFFFAENVIPHLLKAGYSEIDAGVAASAYLPLHLALTVAIPHFVIASTVGGAVAYMLAAVDSRLVPAGLELGIHGRLHADFSSYPLEYFAPGAALKNAREALHDWNGESANRALALMQEAQETDRNVINSLNDLFASFLPVENVAASDQSQNNISSSSSASSALRSSSAAREATETDEGTSSAEPTLTPAQIQQVLINQVEQRIAYREDLIHRLQNKIAAIKAQDEVAKAKANSPAGRLKWGRLP